MLLFRSLTVGLLGGIVLLLAMRPPTMIVREPERTSATIVDVAPGLTENQIEKLVHLGYGERVVAVDGDADHSGTFMDLTIRDRDDFERRVLVLVH
ncbi:MAG: hypothetical protein QM831_08215 [Kofleriaceae bacterium]